MVADPRLALDVMRKATKDGHGGAVLLEGTNEKGKPTIDQALADAKLLRTAASSLRRLRIRLWLWADRVT